MTDQAEEVELPHAQVVANLFIQQYYLSIHKAPEVVHKFYVDSSVLTRPGPNGLMTTATTVQAIDDLVLSLKYNDHHTQILTVDAQLSHDDGVIIMVTGCLTGSNERKKFAQTFFLAPQIQDKVTKGYYVLNDVFRFIDDLARNATDEISQPPMETPITETEAADEPVPSEGASVEVEVNPSFPESQVTDSVGIEKEQVLEKGEMALGNGHAKENGHVNSSKSVAENIIPEAPVSTVQEDAPKKSFASVVNALNKNAAPFHVRAPLHKPAVQPLSRPPAEVKPEAPATEAPAAAVDAAPAPERTDDHAAKAHAIFVANLPMSATVEELDKLFKQFGPIKPHGIQVRSNKLQGTCFGFVEFESASSLQSALEASPIVFGTRKLSIEERRANNERAKYPSGRSGYRNDGFRGGRGSYNGNGNGNRGASGYRRNDFEKRGEFMGRARGSGEANLKPATTGADKDMQEAPVIVA